MANTGTGVRGAAHVGSGSHEVRSKCFGDSRALLPGDPDRFAVGEAGVEMPCQGQTAAGEAAAPSWGRQHGDDDEPDL